MNRPADRMRHESGQVIVFVVAVVTILIGMAALVIDGGSWLRAQRHLQTAADAGALAGAQNLPTDQTGARSNAISYAQTNYSGIPAPTITFPTPGKIHVEAQTTAPGFLAKIYGSVFSNVTIRAKASAELGVPLNLKNVAPIAVKRTSACAATSPSCYGQTITLGFDESNVSSSTIGLINLTCHSTASTACGSSAGIGASQLKDWIVNGYGDALPSNQWYGVKTGETIGPIKAGLAARAGTPLFFPVFDTVANSGSNYFFHIIGWAAFVIDTDAAAINWSPSTKTLRGHFVTFIATDLASEIDPGATDFGVHVISLTE
jgi:Flp pilus assembly protein TadG